MGKIEEIIYENYKNSIEIGDFEQAKRAIELAQVLKSKVEVEGFLDYDSLKVPGSLILGAFFNPLPYRYNPVDGVVELSTTAITLTESENKLFKLFSQNESKGKNIVVITKSEISKHLWGEKVSSSSAIRIAIYRLRKKIELDTKRPRIIIKMHSKGYVFLGNKVEHM